MDESTSPPEPGQPASETVEAIIAAPVETVWRLLARLERWPQWRKKVSRIRVDGPHQVGTRFVWISGRTKTISELKEVVFPERLAWSGRGFGLRALHTCELRAFNNFTHIRATESFEGPLAFLFPGLVKKKVAETLEEALAELKSEAEAASK